MESLQTLWNTLCWKIPKKSHFYCYEPTLILKPLVIRFCPLKMFSDSFRSFYTINNQNLKESENIYKGQKRFTKGFLEINVARFARKIENFWGVFKHCDTYSFLVLLSFCLFDQGRRWQWLSRDCFWHTLKHCATVMDLDYFLVLPRCISNNINRRKKHFFRRSLSFLTFSKL